MYGLATGIKQQGSRSCWLKLNATINRDQEIKIGVVRNKCRHGKTVDVTSNFKLQ
jgi:hypothetical protein